MSIPSVQNNDEANLREQSIYFLNISREKKEELLKARKIQRQALPIHMSYSFKNNAPLAMHHESIFNMMKEPNPKLTLAGKATSVPTTHSEDGVAKHGAFVKTLNKIQKVKTSFTSLKKCKKENVPIEDFSLHNPVLQPDKAKIETALKSEPKFIHNNTTFPWEELECSARKSTEHLKHPTELFRADGRYTELIKTLLETEASDWLDFVVGRRIQDLLNHYVIEFSLADEAKRKPHFSKEEAAQEIIHVLFNQFETSLSENCPHPMPKNCIDLLKLLNKIAFEKFPQTSTSSIVLNLFIFRYLLPKLLPENITPKRSLHYMQIQNAVITKLSKEMHIPGFFHFFLEH